VVCTVIVVLILILRNSQAVRPPSPAKYGVVKAEDTLEVVRDTLSKATDLATCRTVLQQLNTYNSQETPLPLALATPELRRVLQDGFHLDAGEMEEVTSANFTALDAHHLDECFLFRDAAHFLSVEDLPVERQAASAFAWVVRQVRLRESPGGGEVLPPAFVL